jgi:hypothetical protein|nr:MAG TPA: hypothetical protein [Caudoviricetes sp.]
MAAACALAIFSGKIIFNIAFVAACGRLKTHFHEMGPERKTAFKTVNGGSRWTEKN